jgi:hypothetical protein
MIKTFTHSHDDVLHFDTFPMVQKFPQSELICKSYASRMLTYLVDHHGMSGCHISPHYSHIWV